MGHIATRDALRTMPHVTGPGGANGNVSNIRIMLVAIPGMLTDIIGSVVSEEPDMVIAKGYAGKTAELGAYTRRKRIDIVIFLSGDAAFTDQAILDLFRTNPRLSLLEMDGGHDQGTLHHLVPAHNAIGRLANQSLTSAIRAGAALRLR